MNDNKHGPRVKCLQCGDIIQSMHRHDFKLCKGKHIFVDGGADYLRMGGDMFDGDIMKYEILDATAPESQKEKQP